MEKWCFMLKEEFERGYGLSNSMDNIGSIENTIESEDGFLTDPDKNIPNHNWVDNDSSSYSNLDHLVGVRDILKLMDDDTLLVKDRNGDGYYINFSIKNKILEVNNDHSFLSELENIFYNYQDSHYWNNGSQSDDSYYDRYMYDTKKDWNKHSTRFIENYLHSQILIHNYILSDSGNYSDSYFYSFICGESRNSSESENFGIRTSTNSNDLTIIESFNDLDVTQKYRNLWVQCDSDK